MLNENVYLFFYLQISDCNFNTDLVDELHDTVK